MQTDLQSHKGIVWPLFTLPKLSRFLSRPIHNTTQYIHMVDMIDRAAKEWLSLIQGINLNVFQGFESEKEMVNFFLSKAYPMNISVIAGEEE
jgi:hypothetical protein